MELQIIKTIVENYFGYPLNQKSRMRHIVDARRIYYRLCREFTNRSLFIIGKTMDRDHATALHGVRSCIDLCRTDKDFNNKYLILFKKVQDMRLNNWALKRYELPKAIHPGRFRYGDKKSIREIFNKRR